MERFGYWFMTVADELQYGSCNEIGSKRLTTTFRCPWSVVCNNALTKLQVVSTKTNGSKPILRFCNIWSRSDDNEGCVRYDGWRRFPHPTGTGTSLKPAPQ
jgi:hypothetical protein